MDERSGAGGVRFFQKHDAIARDLLVKHGVRVGGESR